MIEDLINQIQDDLYAPVSFDVGFNIRKIKLSLPESHKIWEDIALNLADALATFRFKEMVINMPVLNVDDEHLPAEYLLRASILITGFAHAFYYPQGYSSDVFLPDSILIPMEQIAARIGKKASQQSEGEDQLYYVGRTYLEDFSGNWKFINEEDNEGPITLDKIQIDNIQLMLPYFCNKDEYVSTVVTGALMQARFAPMVKIISDLELELSQELPNPDSIITLIMKAKNTLEDVKSAFMLLSPKLGSKYFVDQIIWPQTSPTMGKKAHPSEYPNTGADSPLFHILDKLLNRVIYDSKMGQNIVERFKAIPVNYQKYILAVEPVGEQLFSFVEKSRHEALRQAYTDFVIFYAGPNGFMDAHRKKAYGYLKMSFLGGRLSTNGKEQGKANTREDKETGLTPWGRLNMSFLRGMEERLDVLRRLSIYAPSLTLPSPDNFRIYSNGKKFAPHKISGMQSKGSLVASYRGQLFSLHKLIKTHPGGHRIIQSLVGGDMTIELEQVHVVNLPRILNSLKKDYLGDIEEPVVVGELQEQISNWTNILFLMSAVQNNIQNLWYFDEHKISDRNRFVPFQFVMKTIHIIFGVEGYFDSLLDRIDTELVKKYREKRIFAFTYFNKVNKQDIKFQDIGYFVQNLALTEICEKGLKKAEETHVNQLDTCKIYTYLVLESIGLLESLKNQIIEKIDEALQDKQHVDEFHDQLVKLIDRNVDDFISSIDTPKIFSLVQPVSFVFSATSILGYLPKIKIDRNLAACASLGLAILIFGIIMENASLQEFGCYLLIASGLSLSRNHFFQKYEPKEFEPPLENHVRLQ